MYLNNISDEKEFRIFLGNRLRIVRKQKNLTQAELAELLDLSNNYISEVERGNYNLSLFCIFKTCDILKITIHEFCGITNDSTSLTLEQRDIIGRFFEYFKEYNNKSNEEVS